MNIQFQSKMLLFGLLALALSAFRPAIDAALPGRWELLGMRKVNYALDRDEIFVTARDGVFSALKIKVNRSPINLHKIVVHFGNGDVQEIETRHNLPAGGETRVIDLEGNKRVIQKVVFWYEANSLGKGKRSEVHLWGLR